MHVNELARLLFLLLVLAADRQIAGIFSQYIGSEPG